MQELASLMRKGWKFLIPDANSCIDSAMLYQKLNVIGEPSKKLLTMKIVFKKKKKKNLSFFP